MKKIFVAEALTKYYYVFPFLPPNCKPCQAQQILNKTVVVTRLFYPISMDQFQMKKTQK